MQRTLLNFESTYGRPQERNDRILMRPVYDRYRFVKRLLAAAASQDCVNDPDTPARVFAPPDVLESASVLSPLQMQTTTQHSDTCFSFIDNSSGDSAAAGDPVNVPSRYPPRHPSNENSQYPLVLSSSITSRGASLNSSSNSKTIPDEWCKLTLQLSLLFRRIWFITRLSSTYITFVKDQLNVETSWSMDVFKLLLRFIK